MARPIRIEYAGAAYHVMARGNQGRAIFADDHDRRRWLGTLEESCDKTGWRIHAWVMMTNHYHLLLETPEANLVAGMKWFQGTYTQRYNSRHEVFGHLFQGRYKALVVDRAEGNYFGVVSTYIHLNPARAKLIRIGRERLERYPWSSYPSYLKTPRQRPGWLVTERVMGDLGLEPGDCGGYEAYVEGRVLELGLKAGQKALAQEWKGIRRGWYQGGEGFRGRLLRKITDALQGKRAGSYAGEAKRDHGEAQAERLLRLGLAALKIQPGQLEAAPKGAMEKQALGWWLCEHTTVPRRWVSERLAMGDESRVTRAIRLMKQSREPAVQRLKRRVEVVFKSEPRR